MSQKYDPNYNGSNDITPEKEQLNNLYEENHNSEDDFDDDDYPIQQNNTKSQLYFYEQPWLNNEDFF